MLSFHDITKAPAILRDSAAVPIAVGSHRRQILERANCPEGIHDLLKLTFEFIGVEPVAVMGPPGMVEFFSGRTEVHSHMADCAQRLIGGLLEFRIEEARFLGKSGPEFIFGWSLQTMLCAKFRECDFIAEKIQRITNLTVVLIIREGNRFRHNDRTSVIDHNQNFQHAG